MANNENREAVALLPCPFCGAVLEHSEVLSTRRFRTFLHPRAGDRICVADSTIVSETASGERIAAWNRRPVMEAVAWRDELRSIIFTATHAVLPLADDVTGLGIRERAAMQVEIADRILQALAVIPTEGLGSSLRDTHRVAETAVVVPRDQLETLRRSLELGNLLPGEGETLINCWIFASDAESKV